MLSQYPGTRTRLDSRGWILRISVRTLGSILLPYARYHIGSDSAPFVVVGEGAMEEKEMQAEAAVGNLLAVSVSDNKGVLVVLRWTSC